ncbi:MAG: hypothetical protein F4Y02_16440 [Chloroflexi bacterium]|nr:hypothetical protein [Chloroflexota bacterium]
MSPHRIGIVGCGRRGRAFAAAVASLETADLVLCVDDDPAAAHACASAFGGTVAQSWTDEALDTLIMAGPRLDAASLAAAVRNGLQVLADAPLARGIVDARRAVRAVQGAQGKVGMGFDWRFEPLVRLLRALTPRPLFAHISMAVDPGPPEAPESVRETMWTTPHHALDLLMYLFDGPPAEIVADGGPLPERRGETATSSVPPRADALVADLYLDRERHAALTVGGGDADPELGPVVLDLTDGATRVRVWSNWTVAEILPLDGRFPDAPPLPGVRMEREGRALLAQVEPDGQALRSLAQAFIASEPADDRLADVADGARAVVLTRAVLAAAASGRTQTFGAA